MKRIFACILAAGMFLAAGNFASAQDGRESWSYRRDYRADVEFAWMNPGQFVLSTSHGYSFGNGLYVGGGIGLGFDTVYADKTSVIIPVFAEVKYSFLDKFDSPFVSVRLGEYADCTNYGLGFYFNPAVGVDLGRFNLKLGYELQKPFAAASGAKTPRGWEDRPYASHVKVSVGFAF